MYVSDSLSASRDLNARSPRLGFASRKRPHWAAQEAQGAQLDFSMPLGIAGSPLCSQTVTYLGILL